MIHESKKDIAGSYSLTTNTFPTRKLTRKEKKKKFGSEEKWAIAFMEYINGGFGGVEGYKSFLDKELSNVCTNLDLIEEGIFNKDELNGFVQNYVEFEDKEGNNKRVNFPIEVKHYDILSSKVNVLVGEEIKRPFNYFVYDTGAENASKVKELSMKLAYQLVEQDFLISLQQEYQKNQIEQEVQGINNPQQAQVSTPDGEILKSMGDIKKYVNHKFKNGVEHAANDLLEYLIKEQNLIYLFNKNFTRLIASDREIYCIEDLGGALSVKVVDPRYFTCSISHDEDFIDDAEWKRWDRFLTVGQIIDEFYDFLEPVEIDKIEEMQPTNGWADHYSLRGNYFSVEGNNTIRVTRFEFSAMRKIGFLTRWGAAEEEVTTDLIDEDYQLINNDEITEQVEWKWINETWEGYKIGHCIYTKIRPLPNQQRDLDNLSKCTSSFYGYKGSYSLIDKVKPFNYLYNVALWHLKMTFAKAIGNVGIVDISQIPKKDGWDIPQWLYYMKMFGLMIIDPTQSNDETKRPSGFNQYTSIDLSAGATVQNLINQIEMIKQEIGDITGITRAREGQVTSTETVGSVERSISQSAAITETLFYIHSEVKKRVLQATIDKARHIMKSGQKIVYVLDDFQRKVLEITEDLKLSNLSVFVSNSFNDNKTLETLKDYAKQQASSKTMSLHNLVSILRTTSLAEASAIAEQSDKQMQEQQMQQIQAQQQAQQQAIEAESINKEEERQIKLKDQEIEMAKANIEAQSRIKVAEISASAKTSNPISQDANRNGVLDIIEPEKLILEQEKLKFEKQKHKDEIKLEKGKNVDKKD